MENPTVSASYSPLKRQANPGLDVIKFETSFWENRRFTRRIDMTFWHIYCLDISSDRTVRLKRTEVLIHQRNIQVPNLILRTGFYPDDRNGLSLKDEHQKMALMSI